MLWANPHVVGVQSRLYSPGYVGPARWVLFDPTSRRAFSALGKDVVPEVVAILAAAADGAPRDLLAKAASEATAPQIDGLVDTGLLTTTRPTASGPTFVSEFHTANVDYPFFDYGSDEVVREESRLLDHYDSLWPSPPALADRHGPRFELPAVELDFPTAGGWTFPNVTALSQILFTLLSPIGEIRTRYTTCIRRTMPSGGARHPTEVIWVSDRAVGDIPPGSYSYDSRSHSLVREPDDTDDVYRQSLGGAPYAFVVRSRVARAMWRYRDLRALRPLLIDAGHVVEMLTFLLARGGVPSSVSSPTMARFPGASLDEPELAVVHPTATSLRGMDSSLASGPSRSVRTNPAMALRFHRTMTADVLWPRCERLGIDHTDFLVLNHCLPSTRGDRDCSYDGIQNAVAGSDTDTILRLEHAGALLADRVADSLYKQVQLWVRHEWYVSLLALTESASDGGAHPVSSRIASRGDYVSNPDVLRNRCTSRAFLDDSIPAETLIELLRRAIAEDDADLSITVAALNVRGLHPGLYSWHGASLKDQGRQIERSGIAAATAGQSAASAGAVTLWLSLRSRPSRPASYVMDLLDLGRVGQRLCEVATDLGLGVFLTPAAYDSQTCSLLGLSGAEELLTYVFAFGVKRSEDDQRPAPP